MLPLRARLVAARRGVLRQQRLPGARCGRYSRSSKGRRILARAFRQVSCQETRAVPAEDSRAYNSRRAGRSAAAAWPAFDGRFAATRRRRCREETTAGHGGEDERARSDAGLCAVHARHDRHDDRAGDEHHGDPPPRRRHRADNWSSVNWYWALPSHFWSAAIHRSCATACRTMPAWTAHFALLAASSAAKRHGITSRMPQAVAHVNCTGASGTPEENAFLH